MSDTANEIIQWIGVGIALGICLIYVFRKIKKKKHKRSADLTACSDCPLMEKCSKKTCKEDSSDSCCH